MRRTIIVTGASRGIGLAITQFLLASGAQVVTVQRSISAELRALEDNYTDTFRLVQGDCTEDSTIQRTVQEALNAFGRIHGVVFNAAALGAVKPVAELSIEEWRQTFDANFFSIIKFLKEALPELADDARIVFLTSSVVDEFTASAAGPYSASKAALNSLNRTLAVEHPGKVCLAVHPGSVGTKMHYDFVRQAKAYNEELLSGPDTAIKPELPGRVIAQLALRAPAELTGRYLHWDSPELSALDV